MLGFLKKFLGLDYYVSGLDQFLKEYRKKHPQPSVSQCQEIKKYDKIFSLRDTPNRASPENPFWNNF